MNEELIITVQGDNYIYILQQGDYACVIDPAGYQAVKRVLTDRNLQLKKILNTHCHLDHTGGNLIYTEGTNRFISANITQFTYATGVGDVSAYTGLVVQIATVTTNANDLDIAGVYIKGYYA